MGAGVSVIDSVSPWVHVLAQKQPVHMLAPETAPVCVPGGGDAASSPGTQLHTHTHPQQAQRARRDVVNALAVAARPHARVDRVSRPRRAIVVMRSQLQRSPEKALPQRWRDL